MSENTKETKKTVIWEFVKPNVIRVSSESNKADSEKKYSFNIERFKDVDTHEESLKIYSFYEGADNGAIVSTVYDLGNDIKRLMRYGVVLSAIEFREIQKKIEENYTDLPISPVSTTADNRLADLIEQVKEYVNNVNELITEDFCYIPVGEFNGLAEDCGYYSYEMKTLRSMLVKDKYIRVTGDRFAGLTRIKDKPTRVMIFYREKLGVEVPAKKDKKHKEMSGANEE